MERTIVDPSRIVKGSTLSLVISMSIGKTLLLCVEERPYRKTISRIDSVGRGKKHLRSIMNCQRLYTQSLNQHIYWEDTAETS